MKGSESLFSKRHLGTNRKTQREMLQTIGVPDLDTLIDQTIPPSIRLNKTLKIPQGLTEADYLSHVESLAKENRVRKNFIGQGYYGTIVPSVLLRNIFENPGWYTQYTPYQAEISQGRLEALLNFQTMVSELTGFSLANASLLDEGTAAAEAMAMFFNLKNKRNKGDVKNEFLVDRNIFDATLAVVQTRAATMNIDVRVVDTSQIEMGESTFGVLVQYPGANGGIEDYTGLASKVNEAGNYLVAATDLMSLCLLKPPGHWGAHCAIGNTQRFGVPMGFGGPHAAFFATDEQFKRQIPGRIIGVSKDRDGNNALRMALQTREQHIKRERATSNICTAQALLAIMAGMYTVYHGTDGLRSIANEIHRLTTVLYNGLKKQSVEVVNRTFFDTLTVRLSEEAMNHLRSEANRAEMNFYYDQERVSISLDETISQHDVDMILAVFARAFNQDIAFPSDSVNGISHIPEGLIRNDEYLTHPTFKMYQTETDMMRYIKRLENKDLSLVHSMIPLGSCTMKLNAATQLIPVGWSSFAHVHPYTPEDQVAGYLKMIRNLENYLSEITGFTACSLQPNSGAQGEFAGLLVIRAYHDDRGDLNRNVALIPSSAHGTNPASAIMAGMRVIVVKCDDEGNIDLDDLREKIETDGDALSALMITYPSTHGVFETEVRKICDMVHQAGGLVYMDGANMNAQVGLTSPGLIGADVCHLNLHKTFSIPHGGGGPGMGPICVNDKLAPYLPGHPIVPIGESRRISAVSSAPWGSASILLISYAYIRLLGREGVLEATKVAILNANYIKARLEHSFEVLYTGENGRAAHELIIDLRPFKGMGVSAEDVAKRLIDYGFHAPTLSFPVPGTFMIEPTESESKRELDRFCDAMLQIREEIDEIDSGQYTQEDNVLVHAPHTQREVAGDEWKHAYSRSKAGFPYREDENSFKFWPSVARVDNAFGDRNLVCTCPPIESYMEDEVPTAE